MKKILVPIDFTDNSNNAFRMATYMARVKGMAIKLLHIIEESRFNFGKIPFFKKDENMEREMELSTREQMERLAALIRTNEINIDYEVRRSKASVAKEILNENCDLIIMGRKSEGNQEVSFTGSTTEKVVRLSPIPVITVGYLPLDFAIRKIVFASDFHDIETRPIIQRVFDLSNIFSAELHFLYVEINRQFLSEETTKEKVKEYISNFDLKGKEIEVYFAPTQEDGITQYINENKPDLLVLCTHGRKGIAHFFIGSIAENMAAYANIPVLTYNINPYLIEKTTKPIMREKINWGKRAWEKI
jgi:nucleotide-binding universal stress UspA family protein